MQRVSTVNVPEHLIPKPSLPKMLLKINSISNKTLERYVQHSLYLAIVIVLIPVYLYFELVVVFPTVAEQWSFAHIIHLTNAAFVLLNIIGNMMYGMLSNTSIKGKILDTGDKRHWTFCTACESFRPPRSWHCETCNICILRRDHHCTYFACCIGYFNHRYFMCFVLHIFLAMVYSLYFNVKYLSTFMSWNSGLVIAKFVFPLLNFVFNFNYEIVYIFLLDINVVVALLTGYLLYFHLNNILKGQTTPEAKSTYEGVQYNQGWRENLEEVFGSRWYLTWMSPFINSPLPGDGVKWNVKVTSKDK